MRSHLIPLLLAAAAALPAGARAQAATYQIDPLHTFVIFEVMHFGTSTNRGRFDRSRGTVTLDRTARSGAVDITVETRSVNTGVEAFTKSLLSRDFLSTAEHPTARFTADRLVFDGPKLTEVQGELMLLGIKQPFTLKALNFNCYENSMFKREVCGGDFEGTLQRSRYGIQWGLNLGFPDAVRLLVQVEAIRQ